MQAAPAPVAPLPTPEAAPSSPVPVLVVVHVAALALLVQVKHAPKLGLLEPAWVAALCLGLPLAAVAAMDATRRAALARAIGLFAAAAALAPAAWRFATGGPKSAFLDDPATLLGPAAVAVALGALAVAAGRVDPDRWGLGLGDWRWWGPRTAALVGGIVPLVLVGAWLSPELVAFYPDEKVARASLLGLARVQLGVGLYMLAWEFFYRGFLLFGVGRREGPLAAAIVQAFPFFLMHRSKPELEMASSFVGGVALGLFCWRARSFWPAFLLHWALNATMDLVGFAL